jgi:uncharacterized protein
MDKSKTVDEKDLVKEKVIHFYNRILPLYPVKKIILFGSYAKGCQRKDSDIDIGVVIDLPKNAATIKITSRLIHFASEIDTSLEPIFISWNEYQQSEKGSILSEIIKTGIEII